MFVEITQKTKRQRIPVDRSGFTVMEIMIALGIMAIMAAFVAPDLLGWLPNMRLKSAARDLYANMQKARGLAVRDNADRAIYFDTANDRYFLCTDKGADDDWTTIADNTVLATVTLASYGSGVAYGHNVNATPVGTTFDDDVTYAGDVLVFNSRGTGSAGYVYLVHQDASTTYAVGTRSSGVIKLLKWKGSSWQ